MFVHEALAFSVQALRANPIRSLLTGLGMVIGTASVILVVTISLTSREYILEQVEGIGSNIIFAYYPAGSGAAGTSDADFIKLSDVEAVRQQLEGRIVAATGVMSNYDRMLIRSKEEDAWLIEAPGPSVEASLRKESLIIVLVRAGKAGAADVDCALLQKYKGRRMQEFDNTKMKAVLVGNYFSAADPRTRGNPFSALQIEEATKDGNGLLTTWDLFKAVKAEKEGRVAKDALRAQVKQKSGVITFEY